MKAEEPALTLALALDAIEGRVPLHGLAHAGDGAHDKRVEAAPDVAFPARHGRDVGLHGGVAVGLCDLRVAACEEGRLRGLTELRLRRRLARFGRLRSEPIGGDLLCDFRRPIGHVFAPTNSLYIFGLPREASSAHGGASARVLHLAPRLARS